MGLQNTLKALADPIRREILNLLKNGPLSAGEIVDHFSVTGASISRHLSVSKEADLIRECLCAGGDYAVDHRFERRIRP